jgi:midasin
MRRVIEYIASDYRKDKFWLRRFEPNKRQYQVMVAIDDSASMVFNHSKQVGDRLQLLLSDAVPNFCVMITL